jgi:hypothetical protein
VVSDLLEPCEAKVSSTDLRGGGGGDTLALPGGRSNALPLPGPFLGPFLGHLFLGFLFAAGQGGDSGHQYAKNASGIHSSGN